MPRSLAAPPPLRSKHTLSSSMPVLGHYRLRVDQDVAVLKLEHLPYSPQTKAPSVLPKDFSTYKMKHLCKHMGLEDDTPRWLWRRISFLLLGGCKYTTAANMDKNKTWANQDKLKMACVFNALEEKFHKLKIFKLSWGAAQICLQM
ncbi:hypothetical protein BDV98DRAFT_586754 [Pterulicium gracile]|uniref:Uncharacterized protein n=1 Tax=Pterulicium gracile TaxID=1884261 RepID=A0A5C3Q6L7_9AGAR|nr:hypothetical protein BDV98DRAFT_586754 [Pterula gracilis]